MTQLDDHALSSGIGVGFGNIHFDADSDSPSGGGDGGNQGGVGPLASSSYVHWVSERIRLGLNFYSVSASILDPDNDWAGRFELTELSLLTISLAPSLAIEVTDWLSIGGGPIVTYGVLNWDLRAALPLGGEAKVELDKLDDWQVGGRVGVLLKPREDVAVSIHYLAETTFDLDGKIKAPRGLQTDLVAKLPLVQTVEVSVHWQATDRLALLGTFDWEDWSAADELEVTLGTIDVEASLGFRDTYKIGVGANYLLRDDWLLQAGFMYDTSALKDKDRTTALPVDQQFRAAFGVRHQLRPALTLGFSFVYINLGSGDVSTPNVSGDYSSNDAFVLGFTLDFEKLYWARSRI
jgi:long-chain fatty acid transport protein